MKLSSAIFNFKDVTITWQSLGKNGEICDREGSKFKGKPYKWKITIHYKDYIGTWLSFSSPTITQNLRYIKSMKEQIKQSN